jgi:hypothetical protein
MFLLLTPHSPSPSSQPERGQFPIPPVNTFIYNATVTLPDGKKAYRFLDPQFQDLEYFTTADANEYPIAFYDHRQETAQEFRNFAPVTSWPNGFWNKPAGC